MSSDTPTAHELAEIFQQAFKAHQVGDFNEATKLYQQVLDKQPQHCETWYNLATLYAQSGSWFAAAEHYQRALELSNEAPEILYNLSIAQLNCEQFGAAITNLKQLLKREPEFGEANHLLACLLYKTENQEEAKRYFEKAIELGPEVAQAHFNFGVMLMEGHNLERAKQQFQMAIAEEDDLAAAHYNLGLVLEAMGEDDKAEKALLAAANDDEHKFSSLSRLAFLAKRLGDYDKAIDYCQRGLMLREDSSLSCLMAYLSGERDEPLPAEFITKLFNQYAPTYDHHLRETLAYQGPEQLMGVFTTTAADFDFASASVLDLGCGTGLMAEALPAECSYLAGVDLSEQMLERARLARNYDDVFHDDVLAYLEGCRDQFELVIAADLVPYISDVGVLLQRVANVTKPKGYFIFSFEQAESAKKAGLNNSLRYRQYLPDLQQQIERDAAWQLLAYEPATVRHQDGKPESGGIMLLQRF